MHQSMGSTIPALQFFVTPAHFYSSDCRVCTFRRHRLLFLHRFPLLFHSRLTRRRDPFAKEKRKACVDRY